VQTGTSRRIPIILVHEPFWRGLLDWFRNTLVEQGMIERSDLDLVCVVNEADAVVDAIFDHYHKRGFSPSAREREMQLNL
jgi:hypothetical protein